MSTVSMVLNLKNYLMENSISSFSEAHLEHTVMLLIEKDTCNARPQFQPKFMLNGGQPGVGKSMLNNTSMLSVANNGVIINGDNYRVFHPNILAIQKEPGNFVKHTKDFAEAVAAKMFDHCIKSRYNIIMETTLQNTDLVCNTFNYMKSIGYSTQLNVLAANNIVSTIGINIRYEKEQLNGFGRMVSAAEHDYRYEKIPVTLAKIEKMDHRKNFDDINIYKRDYVTNHNSVEKTMNIKAQNPNNLVNTYLELRNEPVTKIEARYLIEKLGEAQKLQSLRNAPEEQKKGLIACKNFLTAQLEKPVNNSLHITKQIER